MTQYTPYVYNEQHFINYAQPANVFLFMPHHGRYLCADHGRVYSHHSAEHKDHCHWSITHLGGGVVQLQSHHGSLLGTHHDGSVSTHTAHREDDTKWYMEFYNDKVAFKNVAHGRYLSIDHSSNVHSHHQLSNSEEFMIQPQYF